MTDPMIETPTLVRLLDAIEHDVLPQTEASVADGNKIFGGVILDRATLDVVVVGTNEETVNPLFHGEISTLNRYWAMSASERPQPRDCLFVSTHEPCPLCLSAITWSGFDRFFYLFSYQDSRDAFAIPHDLKILAEVFNLPDGSYNRSNAYWTAHALPDLVAELSGERRTEREEQLDRLRARYAELSDRYQEAKDANSIPWR